MSDQGELAISIRKRQGESWVQGHVAFQRGEPYEPPESVYWPSHWRTGWQAAKEDREKREKDWQAMNRRRGELIDREIDGTITQDEAKELAELQAYVDCWMV